MLVLAPGAEHPNLPALQRLVADAAWLCSSGVDTNFSTPFGAQV
jgi:hypothetical protein